MTVLLRRTTVLLLITVGVIVLAGCGRSTPATTDTTNGRVSEPASGHMPRVVASSSIVGDVVRNVGGDAIDLAVLVPIGSDPHSFEPRPRDTAALVDADLIFINGLGLEEALRPMLSNVEDQSKIVELGEAVEAMEFQDERDHEQEHEDESDDEHSDDVTAADDADHEDAGVDPHVWMDPNNVIVWTETIAEHLGTVDPDNADTYAANAESYRAELQELDSWIREQVAQVPETNRRLITDHASFTYFAAEYGFEEIGSVTPGFSTVSEPSAQEIAALQDAIADYDVPAIFVGTTVNPRVAEQIATDTGIEIRRIYTGSLSDDDGPAGTYLQLMRYNVTTIVDALAP